MGPLQVLGRTVRCSGAPRKKTKSKGVRVMVGNRKKNNLRISHVTWLHRKIELA